MHLTPIMNHFHKHRRAYLLTAAFISLLFLLVGCSVKDPFGLKGTEKSIDEAIEEIEETRRMIQGESSAWRDELPKLTDILDGIMSQASGEAKAILADTTNQLDDLATETIQFSDAKAQDLIAQAGSEFRCNAGFVKAGVLAQLQSIEEDLKFWKRNEEHRDQKPVHSVCWINPSVLSLYPSGDNWLIDASNMSDQDVVHVYGYNFWSGALPSLKLHDANGSPLRDIDVTPAYVTHYQINLDFSNEKFADLKPGARIVFEWPDTEDPNTISLVRKSPAKLAISNPVFSPPLPSKPKPAPGILVPTILGYACTVGDSVTLQVTIKNQGETRSGSFVVKWRPDPDDLKELSISRTPLEPGESVDVSFPNYVYKRPGQIETLVHLSNGDDRLTYPVAVSQAPPSIFDYKIELRTWDKESASAAHDGSVWITLVGTKQSTGETKVEGTFRRGEIESKIITSEDLGEIQYAKIRYDDGKDNNGWFLDWIKVTNLTTNQQLWSKRCEQWFGNQAPLEKTCP